MSKNRAVQLLRNILKQHRACLPADLKLIGDKYVKHEFHLHKKTKNNDVLKQFFIEWEKYYEMLREKSNINPPEPETVANISISPYDVSFGKDLDAEDQNILTNEQKIKLVELRKEASTSPLK